MHSRRAALCAALAALASFATSSTRDAHPKWWHLLRGAHAVRPRDGAKPQPNKRALQPHALHLLQTANASAPPPPPATTKVDALRLAKTVHASAAAASSRLAEGELTEADAALLATHTFPPPVPPPPYYVPPPPSPPPMGDRGWLANYPFEWLERTYPLAERNKGKECAAHCAHPGATKIGKCVPRGYVEYVNGTEHGLSDRGRPFCGKLLCCMKSTALPPPPPSGYAGSSDHFDPFAALKTSTTTAAASDGEAWHPDGPTEAATTVSQTDALGGDPGCYGLGCDGYHCCTDPTDGSPCGTKGGGRGEADSCHDEAAATTSSVQQKHGEWKKMHDAIALPPFSQQGLGAVCQLEVYTVDNPQVPESVNATIKRQLPEEARCQVAKVGVKRWVNMCGHNISGQTSPGLYSAEPSDPAFVGANCMYYPEGFEYEKKDGEYESTGEGSAWRTYVRYNTSLDESVGYFQVESGVPTPLSWQLHSDFQSEEYRLAIVMLDVTGSALTARREWHSTLTHKDDAVPDGQSRVVNMLLFDIDSTASNTYEMLAGGLNQRMPKFGESSWGMDYTGPCTYPLGFPPYGTPGRYEFQLHVYRHRNSHNLAEIAKADNLTLAMFEKVVGDDSAGYCTTRAASAARYRKDSPDAATWAGGPFTATHSGVPVKRADGLYGSDDMRNGHNATEPCGAYGCSCEFSPGNCAAA